MTAFDRAWAFIQRPDVEGGDRIVDDPFDLGGLTRWGCSQRAYPDEDIRNLTEARAQFLLKRDYWDACHCDALPEPIAIALFDSSVNQGPSKAIQLLQEGLGVHADGIVGRNTIQAARSQDAGEVVNQFLSHRALRYSKGQIRYRRGWMLRLFRLKDALVMA